MTRAFLAASVLLLASCGTSEQPATPVATEAEPPAVEANAVDGGPVAGTYEVTSAKGDKQTIMLNADGTGTSTDAAGKTNNITYTGGTADEPYCETMEGDSDDTCYNEVMKDGVWSATNPEDPTDTWTVKRAS